jgi:threonine synthase
MGVRRAVEDSSGNAGASMAAYCAKAGIDAVIFAPDSASAAKLAQIEIYGAELRLVAGIRENAARAAHEASRSADTVYASHNLHPYFIEGTKTFAYEILEDFLGLPALPDHIVIPVGNGSLFLGAAKGFEELQRAGFEFVLPRLHLVQVEACAPIVSGAEAGLERPVAVVPEMTIAGGISIGDPPRGREALRTLRTFGGAAVAVTERAVWDARAELAEREGLFVEPTSAAAFAGTRRLHELGVIMGSDAVLIAETGSGLKDPQPAKPPS